MSRFARKRVRLYGAAAEFLPTQRETFRSFHNAAYFASCRARLRRAESRGAARRSRKRFEDPLAPLLEREPQGDQLCRIESDFELSIVDRGDIHAIAKMSGSDYVNILCRR